MMKKDAVGIAEVSAVVSAPPRASSMIASTPPMPAPVGPLGPGMALPERKYFKIGEVAELVGVEPHVLRYWETQFSQLRPHKARSGHRLYRRREVETLLVIKDLLHIQRFTIAGARQALRQQGTTTLLPRAAENAERAVQLSLTPTAAAAVSVEEDEEVVDDVEDDADGEIEFHLASPLARKETLIEIEARDGEELEDALAEQLTAQKTSSVARVEVRPRTRLPQPVSSSRARARALLVEAATALEAALHKR